MYSTPAVRQYESRRWERASPSFITSCPPRPGGELAVEIPDGEPVAERVELGVELGRLLAKRVEVGDEVAAYPVHVDDLEDPTLLLRPVRAPDRRVVVDRPAGRV